MDLESTVLPKKSKKRKMHTTSELEHSTLGDMVDIGKGFLGWRKYLTRSPYPGPWKNQFLKAKSS